MRIRLVVVGICALVVAASTGCSGGSKVEGVVKYKGEPVEGATVVFVTSDGKTVGQGTTDAAGKYTLANAEGKPAIPSGTYHVTVTKSAGMAGVTAGTDPSQGNPAEMMSKMKIGMAAKKGAPKALLPAKYGNKDSTSLKITVPSQDYGLELAD
jgi:hypothetical protein